MKDILRIYHQIQRVHRNMIEQVFKLKKTIASRSLEEMVDLAFGLKETASLLDDARKECTACQEILEEVACVLWVQKSLQDGTDESIHGEFATGTPRVKTMMHIPKRGTDEYEVLMASMGVVNGDLIRPHWPSMVDHVTNLLSEGKEPPPGMSGKTYQRHNVTLRKRKDFPDV